MFSKLFDKLQEIINSITGLMLILIVTVIFAQVIARYILGRSFSWSEEMTRYLFVWLIYLGVNLGIKSNIQFKVDVLDQMFKGKASDILHIFQHVLSIIAVLSAAYGSFYLIANGRLSISPSLHLPMYLVYVVFPIGFLMDIIELIRQIIIISKFKK